MSDEVSWIVPPWLQKDWLAMAAHLRIAAAHASTAAASADLDEVALNLGGAFIALIDADFLRRMIERKGKQTHD